MRFVFRWFCLVVLSGLIGSTVASAQQTGTLAGVVRDAQGAVLPGATVTASSRCAHRRRPQHSHRQHRRLSPHRPSARHLHRLVRAEWLHATEAGKHRHSGRADDAARCRAWARHPAGDHHREWCIADGRRQLDGDADQHHQGSLRHHPDRAESLGDGRAGSRRRHRPARRRRHRGHAAVQPRSVRVRRQPEVVFDRRPENELGRWRRRLDDAVLRIRDVRRVQHADGVGHRRERCQRRLHEHGHQVRWQPLHQRPQLLLHERRAAGRQRGRRVASAAGAGARAAAPAPRATPSTSRTTGAPRSAARSSATARGSSARCAAGGWTSSRSARSIRTVRRRSTTTGSRTTWARRRRS